MTRSSQTTPPTQGPPAAIGRRGDMADLPVIAIDLPVMYEDEGQHELGESSWHTDSVSILYLGLCCHLHYRPQWRLFNNLDLFYHRIDPRAYVSPDLMVVETGTLPQTVDSYRIGVHGPVPLLVIEVLSNRSHQQQDLTNKPIIYARLGVPEYILVDGTGELLPRRLLLKRWRDEESWTDEQDADGGVTSRLGFRVVLEGIWPRMLEAATGRRYPRPDELNDITS